MGINNKDHYTNLSDECVRDGVNCDGSIFHHRRQQDTGVNCDCPCHGNHAPIFHTTEDVQQWHLLCECEGTPHIGILPPECIAFALSMMPEYPEAWD